MIIKKIVGLFFIISWFSIKAQVGIGTTSPNAQLDISSSNQATPANTDGILIPKIDAFPSTNPTASQQGMLVYLTTTTTFSSVTKTPGFYYWDNGTTNWIGFQNTSSTDWNILGNGGTNPSTNFLGTTDNQDIVFKRNNVRAGYIGDPYYDVSYNYNNGNTVFGANSVLNPSINFASQLGVRNTAFGANVMPGLSTGEENTAIGDFALFSNSTGTGNTSIGSGSLYSNSSANYNVAIGRNTLTSSNSANNTGVGFASLRTLSSGANNTALGYNSGYSNSSGSGNIFIGYQAGYSETTSNKLYISNSNANALSALVYGDFGAAPKILRINGQVQVGNSAPAGTGYALPTARGTSSQILQNDGIGGTSWVSPSTLSITEVDPKVGSTTTNAIPKWNGTKLVDGVMTDDGTNVGVGVAPSAGNKLAVNGKTQTTNLQMTSGATANYFLQSDASGNGSWASIPVTTVLPYTTTGAATGIYTITLAQYTIRVFGGVSEVRLPSASGNTGKIFILIGSNGIGPKTLSTSGGGIYDDVTNTSYTTITSGQRFMVQSDGTDWIVIGN